MKNIINNELEVAVIGAGPAGIAAAIQLKRFGIKCGLFEKNQPGGLLRNANLVENYPGFPEGITGPDLVYLMKEHLERLDINLISEEVIKLSTTETADLTPSTTPGLTGTTPGLTGYMIETPTAVDKARIVVVATGTVPCKWEPAESLAPELREHIFYEVSDISHETGKRILIIGAGDAAFDYALNLSTSASASDYARDLADSVLNYAESLFSANEIVIANRSERIAALPVLVERARADSNISYLPNTTLHKITRGGKKALHVSLSSLNKNAGANDSGDSSVTPAIMEMEFDYLLVAIGREPRKDFYSDELYNHTAELKELGLLYEIGDLANGVHRQTSIAVGNGIEAAMKIYDYLKGRSL
ncbi:MAG: NAD(P)/FAD-dependent oxidoreductase [bacterium]|nr:NAD(P)/FAD-dependent oxidoreductase [bacterium]